MKMNGQVIVLVLFARNMKYLGRHTTSGKQVYQVWNKWIRGTLPKTPTNLLSSQNKVA
jgi:hypothetical protein